MPRHKSNLYALKSNEVSLVDFGANNKLFLIHKRRGDGQAMANTPHKEVIKKMAKLPKSRVEAIKKALNKAAKERVRKAADSEEDGDAERSPQLDAALEAASKILAPYADSITWDDIEALAEGAGVADEDNGDDTTDNEAESAPVNKNRDTDGDDDDEGGSGDDEPDDDDSDPEAEADAQDADKDEIGDDESEPSGDDGEVDDEDGDEDTSSEDNSYDEDDDESGEESDTVVDDDSSTDENEPINKKGANSLDTEAPDGVDKEEHEKALAAAKQAYLNTLKKSGYTPDKASASKSDKDEKPAMVKKNKTLGGFTREQRANIEQIFKSKNRELVQKNKELSETVASERALRLDKEVEAEIRGLTPEGEEGERVTKVLKRLKKSGDTEGYNDMVHVLKSASSRVEAAQDTLFTETGSRLSAPGSPQDEIDSLVDEIVQKAAGDMTPEQAYVKALKSKKGRSAYGKITNEQSKRA